MNEIRPSIRLDARRAAAAFAVAAFFALGHASFAQDPAGSKDNPGAVRTGAGLVLGEPAGRDVRVFRGVPFAEPPVGPLRWKPPVQVKPWSGVRTCVEFGPSCPQPAVSMMGPENAVKGPKSEDCLFLNIWTPARTEGDRLPVMFWIHGGGFAIGSGSERIYDGSVLAGKGVVVVTSNYRLGIFGFFAHPALSAESGKGVSGNYGFLDQVEALRWVRRNIAAFGGDPDRVLIFGESAGAVSVSDHIVSPLSRGLFQRAIAQSGSAYFKPRHLREKWFGDESMEAMGERIAGEIGCSDASGALDALRAKTADELLAASGAAVGLFSKGNRFGPVVDGWAFPDAPAALFEKGEINKVPFIAGSNADEGTMFLKNLPISSPAAYRLGMRALYGEHAADVLKLFPAESPDEVKLALNKVTTVTAFAAPARAMCRSAARAGVKAWLYHFTRVPETALKSFGAFHGLEIAYVFGKAGRTPGFDETDSGLSESMMGFWTDFAADGDPNREGLPGWAPYDPAGDVHMEFGESVRPGSGLLEEACSLADMIAADLLAARKDASPRRKWGRKGK